MTACEAGHSQIIDLILDGVEQNVRRELVTYTCETGSVIHACVANQKSPVETMQHLINRLEMIAEDEVEPDFVEETVNKKDKSGIHSLFLAVFQGNYDLCKLLIEHGGADPMQASDPNKVTLLHICAERGYEKLTELLCSVAPKMVFEADLEGNTPLHVVCDWDYAEIVKTFCDTIDAELAKQSGADGNKAAAMQDADSDQSDHENEDSSLI